MCSICFPRKAKPSTSHRIRHGSSCCFFMAGRFCQKFTSPIWHDVHPPDRHPLLLAFVSAPLCLCDVSWLHLRRVKFVSTTRRRSLFCVCQSVSRRMLHLSVKWRKRRLICARCVASAYSRCSSRHGNIVLPSTPSARSKPTASPTPQSKRDEPNCFSCITVRRLSLRPFRIAVFATVLANTRSNGDIACLMSCLSSNLLLVASYWSGQRKKG